MGVLYVALDKLPYALYISLEKGAVNPCSIFHRVS